MKMVVKKTFSIIGAVIPKNKKNIVVYSPWKEGNTEVFYKEVLQNYPHLKVRRFSAQELFGLSKVHINNLFFFYSAKFLVTSHGVCEFKSLNQIHISLFHAVALKKVGFPAEKPNENKPFNFFNRNIDYQVVSSYISGAIFSSTLNLPEKKMLYFGEPLLDEISKNTAQPKRPENHILYCPTWRNDTFYIKEFILHAQSNPEIQWTVSPHPADVEKCRQIVSDADLPNIEFNDTGTNSIIHEFNHVYIDISSVFFHLVYLDAEITIFFPDKERYLEEFGSLYPKFEIFGFFDFSKPYTITKEHKKTLRELFFANYEGEASNKIADFIDNYYKR